MLTMCLAIVCLLATADNKTTLTVDGTSVDRNWVSVSFDGDNAILVFDDQDTWEVDMASVAIAFSYDKEETPTNITDEGWSADGSSSVFDLQGRLVSLRSKNGNLSPLTSHPLPLKKGIYIRNGKKIIVK